MKSKTVTYYGFTAELIDDARYDKFYTKLSSGRWEPDTFTVLGSMIDADTIYIDVGAWIGVTPLWAAARAKKVVAVEPDPFCIETLRFLISRNKCKNVKLLEGALATKAVVDLAENGSFGNSESSLLVSEGQTTVQVKGVSVDEILAEAGPGPKFCKIDIEGFEYNVIDQLLRLIVPEMRGLQLAVHPQLLMKTNEWLPGFARFKAATATWSIITKLRSKGLTVQAQGASPLEYIIKCILLARKVSGTDLIAKATKA